MISFVFTEHSQDEWKKKPSIHNVIYACVYVYVYVMYYINMLNGSSKNLIQSNFESFYVQAVYRSVYFILFALHSI